MQDKGKGSIIKKERMEGGLDFEKEDANLSGLSGEDWLSAFDRGGKRKTRKRNSGTNHIFCSWKNDTFNRDLSICNPCNYGFNSIYGDREYSFYTFVFLTYGIVGTIYYALLFVGEWNTKDLYLLR